MTSSYISCSYRFSNDFFVFVAEIDKFAFPFSILDLVHKNINSIFTYEYLHKWRNKI